MFTSLSNLLMYRAAWQAEFPPPRTDPALANTPTAVLATYGWFWGLDIPFPTFVNEITMAPPLGNLFHGTIGASGTSVFVVPGVPAGWTIQIVGVHFDGTTGDLIYASPAINYTVQ